MWHVYASFLLFCLFIPTQNLIKTARLLRILPLKNFTKALLDELMKTLPRGAVARWRNAIRLIHFQTLYLIAGLQLFSKNFRKFISVAQRHHRGFLGSAITTFLMRNHSEIYTYIYIYTYTYPYIQSNMHIPRKANTLRWGLHTGTFASSTLFTLILIHTHTYTQTHAHARTP